MQILSSFDKVISQWLDGNGIASFSRVAADATEMKKKCFDTCNYARRISARLSMGPDLEVDPTIFWAKFESTTYKPLLESMQEALVERIGEIYKTLWDFEAILPWKVDKFVNAENLWQYYYDNNILSIGKREFEAEYELYKAR